MTMLPPRRTTVLDADLVGRASAEIGDPPTSRHVTQPTPAAHHAAAERIRRAQLKRARRAERLRRQFGVRP